jgi:hypothetical protein
MSRNVIAIALPAWAALSLALVFGNPLFARDYKPVDPFRPDLPSLAGDLTLGSHVTNSALDIIGSYRKIVVYAACPTCDAGKAALAKRLAKRRDTLLVDATDDTHISKRFSSRRVHTQLYGLTGRSSSHLMSHFHRVFTLLKRMDALPISRRTLVRTLKRG